MSNWQMAVLTISGIAMIGISMISLHFSKQIKK